MYPRKITAKDFLTHTAPAVRALFHEISEEEARYKPIRESFKAAHDMHYFDFITADLNEDFDEHQMQHKFGMAAEAKVQALLISQSIEVLCGAVLQIGKQGISLILKDEERYSRGRFVGTQKLSNVIWHGRNQAMHWEDGVPKNVHTKDCFEELKNYFGKQFEFGVTPRNMAWDLWPVIGWGAYEEYEADMKNILEQ